MKLRLVAIAVVFASLHLEAAEIQGTVVNVRGDSVSVKLEGGNVPSMEDKAVIFFKLAGSDEEVAVADAKVKTRKGDSAELKIEKSNGTVEKGQIVRVFRSATSPT